MKTQNARCYLAPYAPARFSYTGGAYVAGDKPEAVAEEFTSTTPGLLHITLVNGCHLTVETGKGYLLGKTSVEGK
jgi:hypothetical protein